MVKIDKWYLNAESLYHVPTNAYHTSSPGLFYYCLLLCHTFIADSKWVIRDKEWPHVAWRLLGLTFMGCGRILRSSLDVQTIKRTASTALMKSRSIFSYYVRIVRNQVYRDHFELISKKQNRIAIANITLQKRTIDESDNKFLKVFYSGSALLVCYPAIYWRLGWQASR